MKRRLILRDSLTFLSLLLVTVVLFLITLFLFRSFASHRQELAQRWSARGQTSLNAGNPDQAIVALRTALLYAPGRRDCELLLAQALGDAGHTDESYNYYLGLWETEPGSGLINRNLARLAAKKNDTQTAVNYYRASIYGTWEGDGTVRRREVRLELSRYLLAQHNLSSARTELLIAGGNAPDDTAIALTLAPLLEQANAPRDALTYYQKALAQDPKNQTALEATARLEYESGHFEDAHRMMEQAIREHKSDASNQEPITPSEKEMLENSTRILAIAPLKKLPNDERVARILKARDLAKRRFDTCNTQLSTAGSTSSPLQDLRKKWTSKEVTLTRPDLLNDPTKQDATMLLVFDTEIQTAKICGTLTGDDALLLLLAQTPNALEP
ncbi:tetratricopeptide repeat protein [Tunturiibacter lichenicola]|uniref:tetratricopeptide repeat protein n=1 Tax=Tunturiibacter lichenicola TaxID=2051959 RepID=UPI003D9ACDBE